MIFTRYDRELPLVQRAMVVAIKAFGSEFSDENDEPIVYHSMRVGMAGRNETQSVLGFLHDVIEDTAVTADILRDFGFDDDTCRKVELLTKPYGALTYEGYVDRIAKCGDPDIMAVKLNDLIDNIRRDDPKEHYSRYAKHMRAYKILVKVYEDSYGTFPGKIQEGNI